MPYFEPSVPMPEDRAVVEKVGVEAGECRIGQEGHGKFAGRGRSLKAFRRGIKHPERALKERNYVLDRMVIEGTLTSEQADKLKRKPMTTAPERNCSMLSRAPLAR